jgi:hypothetical protein
MAYWSSNIVSVNTGTGPNSGNGDDIRDAFIKVNNNFNQLSTFLVTTSVPVDFYNVNVSARLNSTGTLTANNAVITNSFTVPNLSTASIALLSPSPTNGTIVYNTTLNKFQGYANGTWGNITLS